MLPCILLAAYFRYLDLQSQDYDAKTPRFKPGSHITYEEFGTMNMEPEDRLGFHQQNLNQAVYQQPRLTPGQQPLTYQQPVYNPAAYPNQAAIPVAATIPRAPGIPSALPAAKSVVNNLNVPEGAKALKIEPFCSFEEEVCKNCTEYIKFGTDGKFVISRVSEVAYEGNKVDCTNEVFQHDPKPGYFKQCYCTDSSSQQILPNA